MTLSFFDTIIDEILCFDTHGQFLSKKEHISFASLIDTRSVEEVETRDISKNGEIFSFLGNGEIIFLDLDFWEPLQEVAKNCQRSLMFMGTPVQKSVDIGIREVKVSSLQELETLVKNFGNSVHFYTKHTKAIANFLEYNNLRSGELQEVNIGGLESFAI